MKILYVAMKYDYGQPENGYSFEHCNFYESLCRLGHDLIYFDFISLIQKHGREWMNRHLLETVAIEKPDLMFTILFTDEFEPDTLRRVSEQSDTITINWFCDDHWRFDDFSANWAPCFNWVVTTARSALPKYEDMGYANVIKSQWACNHFTYRKLDIPITHGVTFVGQPHGNRRGIIDSLRKDGIKVEAWGKGWDAGRLSQEEMIRLFNQSRVNLNLANASISGRPTRFRRLSGLLGAIPFGTNLKNYAKRLLPAPGAAAETTGTNAVFEQIKGRNFEIPGCGGLLLTGKAENLEDYYEPDKEIVVFENTRDLIEKINYYLNHEDECAAIALAGYERTLREHTYVHRFNDIFTRIGLPQLCVPVDCAKTPNAEHV